MVLAEVSGRPVFVLHGTIPIYRDLRPGQSGKDIEQLQVALRSLGIKVSDRTGFFGESTKGAVTTFYQRIGFEVPTTGDNDAARLAVAKRSVVAAERALAEARQALLDANEQKDSAAIRTAERAFVYAEEDHEAVVAEYRELQRITGPLVPLAELAFLTSFPARVDKVTATVGAVLSGSLFTLSSGPLIIRAAVSPTDRRVLREGMPVTVVSENLGESATGQISTIGEIEKDEADRSVHQVIILPDKSLDARFSAQDVRLQIETKSSGAEVLVVPLAAVSTGANGETTVVLVLAEGQEEVVPVSVGNSGDGWVEVRGLSRELSPGDLVVIGR
jgi:peptidoglycan hydrolase-like protein with peptidoglycan-binding domain